MCLKIKVKNNKRDSGECVYVARGCCRRVSITNTHTHTHTHICRSLYRVRRNLLILVRAGRDSVASGCLIKNYTQTKKTSD
jgi:hypothetical protein